MFHELTNTVAEGRSGRESVGVEVIRAGGTGLSADSILVRVLRACCTAGAIYVLACVTLLTDL